MPTIHRNHTAVGERNPGGHTNGNMRIDRFLIARMRRAGEALRLSGVTAPERVHALGDADLRQIPHCGGTNTKLIRYACRTMNGPVLEALFPAGIRLKSTEERRVAEFSVPSPEMIAAVEGLTRTTAPPEPAPAAAAPGARTCPACDQTKPATSEHFSKDSRGKGGLRNTCKACDNAKRAARAAGLPIEVTRTCRACGVEKPIGEFARSGRGHMPTCADCMRPIVSAQLEKARAVRTANLAARSAAEAPQEAPQPMRDPDRSTHAQDRVAAEITRGAAVARPPAPVQDIVAAARLVVEADERVLAAEARIEEAKRELAVREEQLTTAVSDRDAAISLMRGGA